MLIFNVQVFCCFQRSLGSSYCCFSAFSICQTINGLSANGPELKKSCISSDLARAGLGVLICIIIGGAFIGTFTGWVKISGENQKTCGKGYFVSLPQS